MVKTHFIYLVFKSLLGGTLDLPLESGAVQMLCGIQATNPNAIFTWMKDGQPLTRTPVYYKDDGRILVIPDFTPADDGKYTCVTNDDTLSSSSATLNYISPGLLIYLMQLYYTNL